MAILRDFLALPFLALGSLFYSIGEVVAGKHFARRSREIDAFDFRTKMPALNRAERRLIEQSTRRASKR